MFFCSDNMREGCNLCNIQRKIIIKELVILKSLGKPLLMVSVSLFIKYGGYTFLKGML